MIRITIRREAEKRGITTAYQLGQELDISPDAAARLWKGEKYPTLRTLDMICERWGCELGTLVTCVRAAARRGQNGRKR